MLKNNLFTLILISLFVTKAYCESETIGATTSNAPSTQQHKPIAAFLYGAVVDVTDKIKDYSGKKGIIAHAEDKFGDPAPQIIKRIAVIYEGDDKIKPENITSEINQDPWSIDVPVIDPNKKIVAAVYGAFNDITDKVQKSGQDLEGIENPAGTGVNGNGVLPQDRRIVIIYKDEKLKPENILPVENQTCAYGKCNFKVPKLDEVPKSEPQQTVPAPTQNAPTPVQTAATPSQTSSAVKTAKTKKCILSIGKTAMEFPKNSITSNLCNDSNIAKAQFSKGNCIITLKKPNAILTPIKAGKASCPVVGTAGLKKGNKYLKWE